MVARRKILRTMLDAGAALAVGTFINVGSFQVFAASTQKYSARTIDLVVDSPIVDMLSLFNLSTSPARAVSGMGHQAEASRCGNSSHADASIAVL